MSSNKKARRKSSRQWLDRHVSDPFVHQAQREGYRARSAYKLLQLDESDHFLRRGITVVELGAAPGAWSQVLVRRVLPGGGVVIAVDMLEMEPLEGVQFLQGDFREQSTLEQLQRLLGDRSVDLVVSDMSPNLSGVAVADAARMSDLIELALEFAAEHLTDNGVLVTKTFHGSGFSQQVQQFKATFVTVKERKPAASRPESAEAFLVGKGLKQRRQPGQP